MHRGNLRLRIRNACSTRARVFDLMRLRRAQRGRFGRRTGNAGASSHAPWARRLQSRRLALSRFLVEDGALIIVASTIVPVVPVRTLPASAKTCRPSSHPVPLRNPDQCLQTRAWRASRTKLLPPPASRPRIARAACACATSRTPPPRTPLASGASATSQSNNTAQL